MKLTLNLNNEYNKFKLNPDTNVLEGCQIARALRLTDRWLEFDEITLEQIVLLGNSKAIKCRMGHPAEIERGDPGYIVGKWINFRVDEDEGGKLVRADLILNDASAISPHGNLKEFLMKLAGESPELFGCSIVIGGYGEERDNLPPLARVRELYAVDIVDTPAATTALFSSIDTERINTSNTETDELHITATKGMLYNLFTKLTNIFNKENKDEWNIELDDDIKPDGYMSDEEYKHFMADEIIFDDENDDDYDEDITDDEENTNNENIDENNNINNNDDSSVSEALVEEKVEKKKKIVLNESKDEYLKFISRELYNIKNMNAEEYLEELNKLVDMNDVPEAKKYIEILYTKFDTLNLLENESLKIDIKPEPISDTITAGDQLLAIIRAKQNK